jgi:hypothetical protein
MAGTLTYRINPGGLELSLWPASARPRLWVLAATWLLLQVLLAGALYLVWTRATSLSWVLCGLSGMLCYLSWTRILPLLFWQRLGREWIVLERNRLRIVHDYRFFQRLRWDGEYARLEARLLFDLSQSGQWSARSGSGAEVPARLALQLDSETLYSKVLLPRSELEEAIALLERFASRRAQPESRPGMYVVHNN